MVDLNDAGRRLAAHRPAASPSPDEVRQRAAGNRRRHHRRVLVSSAALVAATLAATVVLVAVNHGSRPEKVTVNPPSSAARTPIGLRPVPHLAGARPVDWGELRLWLPPGWTLTDGLTTGLTPKCWTPPAESVYIAQTIPSSCPSLHGSQASVQVDPIPAALPRGLRPSTLNGVKVWSVRPTSPPSSSPWTLYVPPLGVVVIGYGQGVSVMRSLGPSSVYAVLAASYPVRVPKNWRTVDFSGFAVSVPGSWPQIPIPEGGSRCDPRVFTQPSLDLGAYSGVTSCPAASFQGMLVGTITPTDGAWLTQVEPSSQSTASADEAQTLRSASRNLVAAYPTYGGSNTMAVYLTDGSRMLTTTIGLGTDPTIAEEVISSLRPVTRDATNRPISKSSRDSVITGVLGVSGGVLMPSPPPPCGCKPIAGTLRLTNTHVTTSISRPPRQEPSSSASPQVAIRLPPASTVLNTGL